MATWVALLRGVNLGANKRIAMADLRKLLESLGYEEVQTLLQSGNAVFTAARASAQALEKQIAGAINADLGLDIKVLVRSATQFDRVVESNPFVKRDIATKELHAAFLSATPRADLMAGLDRGAYKPDELEIGNGVFYLRLPNGFAGSRFPNLERILGVSATVRTWNTVTRIHQLLLR